jgi:ketosteroid isomerase-like protein
MNFTSIAQLSAALNHAIIDGDEDLFRKVYAPDACIWHNTDGVEQGIDEAASVLASLRTLDRIEIEVHELYETEAGFVQTQDWNLIPAAGEPIELRTASVVTVNGEMRISRMDEYVDSAALAPLGAALA